MLNTLTIGYRKKLQKERLKDEKTESKLRGKASLAEAKLEKMRQQEP